MYNQFNLHVLFIEGRERQCIKIYGLDTLYSKIVALKV